MVDDCGLWRTEQGSVPILEIVPNSDTILDNLAMARSVPSCTGLSKCFFQYTLGH